MLGPLTLPLLPLVVAVDLSQEPFKGRLVFSAGLVLGLLKGGVANIYLALFAPVSRLECGKIVSGAGSMRVAAALTV